MATVASERNVARATAAARPRTRFVLIGHLAFTILNATLFGNTVWVLPMLVQLRFGASDDALRAWQTMAITAAIPTALVLSIFWGELLRRMSLRVYLLLFWLVTIVPLGGIGLVTNYWQLLVLNLISAVGLAGWAPVSGTLLKRFYPDSHHGRIYAVLSMAAHAAGLATVYLVGIWLERDPNAFRIYLPLSAATYLLGVLMLCLLVRVTGPDAPPRVRTTRSWSALVQPIFSMHRVLAQDRTFARYEAAFMTYGGAFMFCDALLPILATTKLGMAYQDFAHSTQMAAKISLLALTLPIGWLNDRIGAVRICALSFGVLTVYPLLLLSAQSVTGIGLASVVLGIGLAGVGMGWMLGPLALAGTPEKAPQYMAIHATLVGVRAVLFQFLGVGLYKLTGSFTVPLIVAACAFLLGSVQMVMLERTLRSARRATTATLPVSPPDPATPPATGAALPASSLARP